jgi:hypothetical protein
MQPCDELKSIVLHHYGKFDSGGQAETVKEMCSLQEGVVIIGNDPNEWVDDHNSLLAWIKSGSSVKAEITFHNLKAMSEGRVGWTADHVTVKFPTCVEVLIRHTRIFHKEDDTWKMVHLHVSVAVPDESMEMLYR